MIGYSEVIQTMAAMIIFSMILLNANQLIHRNTSMQIEGELEQEVISLGQEIIEEARIKDFDQITVGAVAPPASIPGGFSYSTSLGSDAGENDRKDFNDFDDYNNWSDILTTKHGDFKVSVEVFYADETTLEKTSSKSTFKKIEVTISNDFLRKNQGQPTSYKLEFIRNYYAN